MNGPDCQYELLAGSEIGQVKICPGCGQVHLALQHMTLHFGMEAFRTLAVMVSQAQYRIDRAVANEAEAVTAFTPGSMH